MEKNIARISIGLAIFAASCSASKEGETIAPPAWCRGGTLQEVTLPGWADAEPSNKLATAAHFLMADLWKGRLHTEMDYERLRESAEGLVNVLDRFVENIEQVEKYDPDARKRPVAQIVGEVLEGEETLWDDRDVFGPPDK